MANYTLKYTGEEVDELLTRVKEGGGGGVSSWNDLTDKPFEDIIVMGDTVTWDGSTDGKVFVDPFGNGQFIFCQVSDAVPTLSDFANGVRFEFSSGVVKEVEQSGILPLGGGVLLEGEMSFGISPADNTTITVPYNGMNVTITFPKKGVYVVKSLYHIHTLTINGYTGFEMEGVKTIDPKYLPFGGIMRVIVSHDGLNTDLSPINPTIDKTYSEILEHIYNGGFAYVCFEADSVGMIVASISVITDDSVRFSTMHGASILSMDINADGTVDFSVF